ncbi:Asparagine synthetase [Hortaea werneckii]|nr:Asparagine synthetase [Hortaea werneckii]
MNCIVRLSQIITSSKHIYSIQPKPLVPDRCLKQRKLPSNKNRRLREDEEQIPSPSSPSLAIQNTCISSLVRPILRREMLVEHTPVPVALLRIRTVLGIPVRLVLGHLLRHHLLIRDHLLRLVLEAVDPAVSHAVAELLLLAPEDVLGEVGFVFAGGQHARVEGLAQDVLLDPALVLLDHLLLRVQVHGRVEELLAVGQVQVLHPSHRLLVERGLVRRVVEVEVPAENLVRAFARQHHLHAHGFDLA